MAPFDLAYQVTYHIDSGLILKNELMVLGKVLKELDAELHLIKLLLGNCPILPKVEAWLKIRESLGLHPLMKFKDGDLCVVFGVHQHATRLHCVTSHSHYGVVF